ncbi:MAG: UDP-N-acetylmuramate dehydrogenase [Candidatus Saccharimonas sp.]
MDVHTDIPLKNYTTMRIGGNARFMTDVHTIEDMRRVCKQAAAQGIAHFILGGGSNTIVPDEGFAGLVIRNRIPGFEVLDNNSTDVTIKIGAGEDWDSVVKRSVEMRLSGIECLSAIPGTAGGAPVQNIGAYGQELSEALLSVDAYDINEDHMVSLTNEDCKFSYRDSLFRTEAKGRYVITSITLKLYHSPPEPPFYAAVQDYLDSHTIDLYTSQIMRDAVIAIRKEKLPDPSQRPNTGSFFKNAIIEAWQLTELQKEYPDIPNYEMPDGKYKIPTGWFIEQAGFKGELLHGIRVHDKNALVLINESASSYADLAAARDEIIGTVRDTFRIIIEQEPLEMRA